MDAIILVFILPPIFVIVCLFIHIILHELGHTIFGLIENYEFYAFGIGSYAFIKENGKIKFKKYKIPGFGGYSLMLPPKSQNHKIPYFWYFSGGIIFNIGTTILFLLLIIYIPLNETMLMFSLAFILMGLYSGIISALPLKIAGGTDGCKILAIYKNNQTHEYFYNAYMIISKLFEGIRMKEMPKKLFIVPDCANFNNPIFAGVKNAEADRYYDNMEYEKAEKSYKSLISENITLAKVVENEVLCQILYFEIIKGNEEETANLMTKKLKKYIKSTYNNITKKRLMFAYTLLIEKNVKESENIWNDFHNVCEGSLIKGEIETESETMNYIRKIAIERGIL